MDRVERTALVSILINVGLVGLKLLLAAVSGSLALIADAWHSASDVAASALVWAGARISRRGGRARLAYVENVIGLIIGVLILWAAFGIFRRVSAVSVGAITNIPIAIGGSLVAALVSYYAAQYKLHVGREAVSVSLIADGYHSRMDTLTTLAVVVGLMGHAIGLELDRLAAAVVAVFIVGSAIEIVTASIGGFRSGTAASPSGAALIINSRPVAIAAGMCEQTGVAGVWRAALRGRRAWRAAAVIALVLAWASTSIFMIGPGKVGVVSRWGRAVGEAARPGLHVKAPWPVERVVKVETEIVRRSELGFSTKISTRPITRVAAEFYATLWESRHDAGTYEKRPEEALRLTGDENIVDINSVIFYRVADAKAYLYNTGSPDDILRFAVESVIGETVGTLSIDDVLTVHRDSLQERLKSEAQGILDSTGAGIELVAVRLQDMHPPLEVVPAFRDVASAREDKNRIINEALGYQNQVVPTARGEAVRMVSEAEAYRVDRAQRATGEAARIMAMAVQYRRTKAVTDTRLYIETMEELLADIEKYIIDSSIDLEGYDLRMFDPRLGAAASVGD